jgi:RNA polymerase sigma-70 factor (ECF subfamily)
MGPREREIAVAPGERRNSEPSIQASEVVVMRPITSGVVSSVSEVVDPQTAQRREEQRLLARVLRGEKRAWAELSRRYQNLIVSCVLRVLRRYGASFNADDLADLVSEVWVVLLRDDMRKLRLYDAGRGYRLASWLGLMATNCTIDQLRLRASECSYLEDLSGAERLLVDDTVHPESELEAQEAANLARRALDALSSEERAFVISCFHDERAPEELASELGITVNTVYSRKFKIREKLSRIVASLDGGAALAGQPTALAA